MKPELINQTITDGIELRRACLDTLAEPLLHAAQALVDCLESGGKVLACRNGGSAADAQHFAAELVNRFETDRRGLPAIALTHDASVITSIANDFSFDRVFSRQIEALGNPGDLLLAISTSGTSSNITEAVNQAAASGMKTIALTGRDGGDLGRNSNITTQINIPHNTTARIQEMHITCLHILCSLVDEHIFGEK